MLKNNLRYNVCFLVLICQLGCFTALPQPGNTDSLLQHVRTGNADTNSVNSYYHLGRLYRLQGKKDSATFFLLKGLGLAKKISFKKGKADCYNVLGLLCHSEGNLIEAISYYDSARTLCAELHLDKGVSTCYNNIGLVFMDQGNYPRALENYFKALLIREKLNDRKNMAFCYNNIGLLYDKQNNFETALKYLYAAKKIREEIGDRRMLATTLHNIGSIYQGTMEHDKALSYYFQALEIKTSLGDKAGIASTSVNIGNIYEAKAGLMRAAGAPKDSVTNKLKEAEKFYRLGLELNTEMNVLPGKILGLQNLASIAFKLGRISESRMYQEKGLVLAKQFKNKELLYASYKQLSDADASAGNYSAALDNYKKSIAYRDSLSNEEATKKTVQAEMNYEFDKRAAATKAEQDKKDTLAGEEKAKQRLILFTVVAGFALVLIFSIVVLNSYRSKQKANKEILLQKAIIEEKQKEILDSIRYARRIQETLLTSEKYIGRKLSQLRKRSG